MSPLLALLDAKIPQPTQSRYKVMGAAVELLYLPPGRRGRRAIFMSVRPEFALSRLWAVYVLAGAPFLSRNRGLGGSRRGRARQPR